LTSYDADTGQIFGEVAYPMAAGRVALEPFATTGIGFGIAGVPLAQDSLLVEAGLDFSLSATATLGVSYSGQFADEVTDNAVKGRLTWLF
jgi:uncharacterized protein with beta-barrel porin domain